MAINGLWIMLGTYCAGAAVSLLGDRWANVTRVLGHACLLIGALSGVALAIPCMTAGVARTAALHVALPQYFPFANMVIALDGLSAFFLMVVSIVAIAAAIYGPAYLKSHAGSSSAVEVMGINFFVGSMALVLVAGDALTFLLAWEGMTLASYALVVYEGKKTNTHAGLVYIIMAHAGTALLMVVFLTLTVHAGSFSFAAIRTAVVALSGPERSVLFFLALIGLAAKAGVVPLHIWLPQAHPAAPSHVSALMSGVMLKVAIYGVLRLGMDLLVPAGEPLPPSWGWTVLVLGSISAIVGVLYALQQHDLKRLLAFHSVENVGIILMGIGMAMLLAHRGGASDALAVLGLAAALLHTLNHAAFKGLLFLSAGAVRSATHILNIEELGGLARRMPWTAWLFLLGAVAISALPPLNGFVSEWMTYQTLILGSIQLGSGSGLAVITAAAVLALTGALAAACFVKAFGVTFLGRPRSRHAAEAAEVAPSMRAGMVVLAGVCVVIGILPGYAIFILNAPVMSLLGGAGPSALVTIRGPLVLSAIGGMGTGTAVSITAAVTFFGVLALAVLGVIIWPRVTKSRREPTWTCGMTPVSRFDYTATAFAKPLRFIFALFYQSKRTVSRKTGVSPYELRELHWQSDVVDLAQEHFYNRLQSVVTRVAHAIRSKSTGRIHAYIGYVLVTLLITLLVFGRG
ncbi:MAG TPA: proton-conducting transporter membrane subunit [Candidatus Omnitrophota bacterium]|nr:proton-conducting transporter membrane subunit [Candidatus Omnitrophota bacterium]